MCYFSDVALIWLDWLVKGHRRSKLTIIEICWLPKLRIDIILLASISIKHLYNMYYYPHRYFLRQIKISCIEAWHILTEKNIFMIMICDFLFASNEHVTHVVINVWMCIEVTVLECNLSCRKLPFSNQFQISCCFQ